MFLIVCSWYISIGLGLSVVCLVVLVIVCLVWFGCLVW